MATPAAIPGYKYLYFCRSTVTILYYVMGWSYSAKEYVVLGSGVTAFDAESDAILSNPPGP